MGDGLPLPLVCAALPAPTPCLRSRRHTAHHLVAPPSLRSWKAVGLAISFLLAVASHHLIELPTQRWAKLRPRLLTIAPIVVACAAVPPLLLLRQVSGASDLRPSTDREANFSAHGASRFIVECGNDAPLPPGADAWRAAEPCYSHRAFASYMAACVPPDQHTAAHARWHQDVQCEPQLQRTLHLTGDSHMLHLGHGLQAALLGRYKLRQLSGLSPAPVPFANEERPLVPYILSLTNRSRDREVWLRADLERATTPRQHRLVAFATASVPPLCGLFAAGDARACHVAGCRQLRTRRCTARSSRRCVAVRGVFRVQLQSRQPAAAAGARGDARNESARLARFARNARPGCQNKKVH